MAISLGTIYAELALRLDKFETELAKAETQIKQVEKRFEATGQRLSGVGKTLTTGITLPIAGIAAASIKMAMDFNASMADVATLIPGNIKRVEELKTTVQDMAVEVGKSTADLTRGLYQVISAFGDTADTAKILEINAKAAAAGLSTTEEAIALTSAVTKAYGDTSATAVGKVSDLALQTVRLGQTTFPELAASMGKVTPLAAAMGITMEDLFGTMATLTGVTGSAAEVSTQLRAVLQGLMTPSKEMEAAITSLGYANGAAMLESRGLQESLIALHGVAGGSAIELAGLWGSVEAGVAIMALTEGQAGSFDAKLKEMQTTAGATDVAFKEQTEGVNKAGFAWKQLTVRLTILAQQIGDILTPTLHALVEIVSRVVNWFSSLGETTKTMIVTIALLVAAIGPVLMVLGFLFGAIAKVKAGIIALKSAFVVLKGVLIGAKAAFLIVAKGIAALKGAFIALKATLIAAKVVFLVLTAPIGLIIAAVALLAAGVFLLIRNWGTVTAFFAGLWATVREIFSSAVTAVLGFVQSLWTGAVQRFTNMVASIRNIVAGVTDAIAAPFRRAREIVGGITSAIGASLQRLNPFAKRSPSLVEDVKAGVRMIQQEYGKLRDLQVQMPIAGGMQPAIAGAGMAGDAGTAFGAGVTYDGPLIHIQNMTVRSDADIENISRQLYRHIQTQTRAQGGR
ncbi:MAG: hypothetical protein DDT29_01581 [Dehalococcoidia bacterium]|nr:hypothetical protein [Bacillota bacterium]